MKYIEFDMSKPLDFIPIGRIAIDFNPTDMYMPLSESSNFNKYVGGSPANIAVGLARLGCKVGFCGCVSNDQFGDFVVNYSVFLCYFIRCFCGKLFGVFVLL